MILTEQAKTDFKEWLEKEYDVHYYNQECRIDICLNALIIEWLDSINIFINPYPCSDGLWDYEITKDEKYLADGLAFKNRTEATNKAIEKANEIYNTK